MLFQAILVKSDGDDNFEQGEKVLWHEAGHGFPWFTGNGNDHIPGTDLKINDGKWHHVVVVWAYDESSNGTYSSAEMWVDGVKATVDAGYKANTDDNSGDKIFIGMPSGNEASGPNYFQGEIKEIAIWDGNLYALAINSLYNDGSPIDATSDYRNYGSASDLVGYWKMNEASGNKVTDYSTKGNTGTVHGASWERKIYSENGPFQLHIDASGLSVDDNTSLPDQFQLHANFPNPFNPTTTISYDLPEQAQVTLGIYDLLGKKIKTLVNQSQDAGNKIAMWDGTDNLGRQVSAGVYLYQIQAGEFTQTRKMLLLK